MKIDRKAPGFGAVALGCLVLVLSGCTVYKDEGPDPAGKNQKVFVCHNGKQSLQLDDRALRAHLNHGDRLGRCKAG